MAVLRDRPYCQFNFLVDLGDGNTDGPRAGFQEVSAISTEVTVSRIPQRQLEGEQRRSRSPA